MAKQPPTSNISTKTTKTTLTFAILLFPFHLSHAGVSALSDPPGHPDVLRTTASFLRRPMSRIRRDALRHCDPAIPPAQPACPFSKGSHEIALTENCFHSLAFGGRPKFEWAEGNLIWGLMLTSPSGSSWLRGNWEFLVDGFGGGVTHGAGNYLIGSRLLLRYNFVQAETSLVPFCQLGAGGLYNDVYHERSQRMIGGRFEFSLVADIGLRYFVTKNWALVGMNDFQHISNANTCSRNLGVNGIGFSIGAGYFY